jgi:4-amino-4-deoxy-L-arabinose transferase-like glycosyltransferase
MFRWLNQRAGHYLLLTTIAAVLFLPNLGTASLWDIDEGHNAEAAREMLENEDWVKPTFNFQLRVDKPVLLYWLQMVAYQVFGINEFAARLPSALAALVAILAVYELGRGMFGSAVGLLAGVILASAVLFCAAAHFANPDALLNAFTLLSLFCFWCSFSKWERWSTRGASRGLDSRSESATFGRGWFVLSGATMGLAVLAKGPVGLVLPTAVIGLFLLWSRRWRPLLDRRLGQGALAFLLVALPWYIWVGVETKWQFLRGFLAQHNVGRFLNPMESHSGPIYYYLIVLALGLAPWSVFLGPAVWFGVKEGRADRAEEEAPSPRLAYGFLWCWIGVYLVFFSLARTKLPNYLLPVYPPLAVVIARFLDRWRRGLIQPPAWVFHVSLVCLALFGIGTTAVVLLASGIVELPLLRGRSLPGVEGWALLGIVPVGGALAAWWCARRQQRAGLIVSVALTALLFAGSLAAWAGIMLDAHKAPRPLAQAVQAAQTNREIRVACYRYYQPSLVFYCRREVQVLASEEQALDFLRSPLEVYLLLPVEVWEDLKGRVRGSPRLLSGQRDEYRNCDVVVVRNR